MAYRPDPDLAFLGSCSAKELNDLVYLLTHDKDGTARLTESLTTNEKYKRYYPQHNLYWQEIAEEIQLFGGNTFANIFRGGGVLYKEVLCDVCDKMDVNYNSGSSAEQIEENLLMKILQDSLEHMSSEELKDIATELGVNVTNGATAQTMLKAFKVLFKAGGFKSYQLTVIVVNAVMKALIGRGLTLAGNAALTRAASVFVGPIGWAFMAAGTLIDVAGTAYRVTIPAVIQVAYLRKLSKNTIY